ncbi:MAG: hypothetical protein K6G85_07540 [Eubacterium sp.]|nr:hypothetical protein [Eubacterium sp.]
MKNYLKIFMISMVFILGCVGKTNQVQGKETQGKVVQAKHCLFQDENVIYLQKGKITGVIIWKNNGLKNIVYSCEDGQRFRFSKKGILKQTKSRKIKALKKGQTKVTVYFGKKKMATAKVVVTPKIKKKVKKISYNLNNKQKVYVCGVYEKDWIRVIVSKKASYRKVLIKSNNEKIAYIDEKGRLHANRPGTAEITIYALDGSEKKKSFKIYVTRHPDCMIAPGVYGTDVNVSDTGVNFKVFNGTNQKLYYTPVPGSLYLLDDNGQVIQEISKAGNLSYPTVIYTLGIRETITNGFGFEEFEMNQMVTGSYKYVKSFGDYKAEIYFTYLKKSE